MSATKVNVGNNKKDCDVHLCPGQNLYSGINYFTDEFSKADSLEEDLFNLASGIYATDLAVHRQDREHYIRTIDLNVEVVNLHAFARIKSLLESALFTVSRDNWNINFVQKKGAAVTNFDWQNNEGAVLLFSGGIDSMCAAAQFVSEKRNLVLVSHNSHGNHVIDSCQRNVHAALEKHFTQTIKHIHIKVYGRKHGSYKFPEPGDRENTQRTRSFLFLTLAALVTRRSGFNKVLYMAENGQFAIHLPLNQARVGPFSTHTADPQFVSDAQEIFRTLLSNPAFEIQNPFLYKTKAEVFAVLPAALQKEVHHSASCWKISHVPRNQHCGFCIPCISRRIAIEFNGINVNEYHFDIFKADLNTLRDDDDKKRNLIDYLEFVSKFKFVTRANQNDLLNEFPELYNTAFNKDKALNLYERVSAQSFSVFKKYPQVLKIIG
ncbi:MAG TPA: 7-cyano-7-deazaguanine synthase [Bacteroidia bacterium]|nr:7-cyano-7-deazaguanine synthase [Bacteroidia bacterium]